MINEGLSELGFTKELQNELDIIQEKDKTEPLQAAKVIRQESIGCWLGFKPKDLIRKTAKTDVLGILPGRWRIDHPDSSYKPVTGDWLAVTPPTDAGRCTIKAILPRKTTLSRQAAGKKTEKQVIAANLDIIFITSGLDRDYNPSRIERFIAMAAESGAKPIVLLNKADLCKDPKKYQKEIINRAGENIPVHIFSAIENKGLDILKPYLKKGTTIGFVGSSGVGKTTIINRLIGGGKLETANVREKDQRGRHTTTQRELVLLNCGTLVMDTPGLREIQLWQDDKETENPDNSTGFEDIDRLAQSCKFSDCQHNNTPDCALEKALEEGKISPKRLKNYLKLQKEATAQTERQTQTKWQKRAQGKRFAKRVKAAKKHKKSKK